MVNNYRLIYRLFSTLHTSNTYEIKKIILPHTYFKNVKIGMTEFD